MAILLDLSTIHLWHWGDSNQRLHTDLEIHLFLLEAAEFFVSPV